MLWLSKESNEGVYVGLLDGPGYPFSFSIRYKMVLVYSDIEISEFGVDLDFTQSVHLGY